MAYEPLATTPMGRRGKTDAVAMALHGGGPKAAHSTVYFRIGADIAKRLGLTKGSRLAVMEGTGLDAGHAKLVQSPDGYKLADAGDGSVTFTASLARWKHHTTRHKTVPQADVTYQCWGSELTVVLPDWLAPISISAAA